MTSLLAHQNYHGYEEPALVIAKAVVVLLDDLAIVVEVAQYTTLRQLWNIMSIIVSNIVENIMLCCCSADPKLPHPVGPKAAAE